MSLIRPSGDARRSELERLRGALAVTVAPGADGIVTGSGGHNPQGPFWPHPDNHTRDTREQLLGSLREAALLAEEVGLVIALENHVMTALDSPERVGEILSAVDSPAIGLNVDPVNFVGDLAALWDTGLLINRIFDQLGGHIVSGHIKDVDAENRLVVHLSETVPGDGRLDLRTYLRRFEQAVPDAYPHHRAPAQSARSPLQAARGRRDRRARDHRTRGDRPLTLRVAVVTGAAAGIGQAVAIRLARDGFAVVVVDIAARGQEVAAEIERLGGTAKHVGCDVTDRRAVGDAVDGIAAEFGSLDILVNCAGVWLGDFLDTEHEIEYADAVDYVEGEDDPARRQIAKAEWEKLAPVERNQLALDRWLRSRWANAWLAGIDYERYIGYLREQNGYAVTQYGEAEGYEDLGRDILAERDGAIEVIQCKRWGKRMGLIREQYVHQLVGTVISLQNDNPPQDRHWHADDYQHAIGSRTRRSCEAWYNSRAGNSDGGLPPDQMQHRAQGWRTHISPSI